MHWHLRLWVGTVPVSLGSVSVQIACYSRLQKDTGARNVIIEQATKRLVFNKS